MSGEIQWGDVATWAAAAIAVFSAAMTVWWPWHARRESRFVSERSYPVGEMTAQGFSHLVMACDFKRPYDFLTITNNGDGTAHDIRIIDRENVTTHFMELDAESYAGFRFLNSIPSLKPSESMTVVLLADTEDVVLDDSLVLAWDEEPIRLKRSRRSGTYGSGSRLKAQNHLGPLEKSMVLDAIRVDAHEFGRTEKAYIDEIFSEIPEWIRDAIL